MMFLQVVANVLQVRYGGRRPPDTHLGAEHLFKPGVHFVFLDELGPVGIRFAFQRRGAETRIFIQKSQSGILQKFNRVALSRIAGDLRQLRFLLDCEMNFHVHQDTGKLRARQAPSPLLQPLPPSHMRHGE